jgi:hypothetical protein
MGKQDWRYVSGGGQVVHGAHAPDAEITSLAFSADDQTLLSRATDDTVRARPRFHLPPCPTSFTFESSPLLLSYLLLLMSYALCISVICFTFGLSHRI